MNITELETAVNVLAGLRILLLLGVVLISVGTFCIVVACATAWTRGWAL